MGAAKTAVEKESVKMKLLRITPEKIIEFPHISFQAVTQIVKLENLSEKKVAFKIKTTAPNNYLVRPSFGIINVDETVEIQIILQPLSDTDNISTDKFQVQCLNIDDDVTVDKQFWSSVNKSNIQDHKLVVMLSEEATSKYPQSTINPNNTSMNDMNNKSSLMNYAENSGFPDDGALNEGMKGGLPGMQRKYHELLNYCVFVDKQKAALEKENESLKNQLKTLNSNSSKFFIEGKFVPIIIVFLAVITKYLGYW